MTNKLTGLLMFALAMMVVLSGCATDSGIMDLANDEYMISKQAATGFHTTAGIRQEVMQEAIEHCASLNGEVEIVDIQKTEMSFGVFPQFSLRYKCSV